MQDKSKTLKRFKRTLVLIRQYKIYTTVQGKPLFKNMNRQIVFCLLVLRFHWWWMWPVNVVTQTTTTSPWCACRNCLKRRADSTSLPSLATSLVNKNQMCVSFSQVLNIVWLYSLQAYDQCYCRCYPYSFSSLALLAACFTGWNYLSLIILIVVWLTSFGICFVAVIVKCDSFVVVVIHPSVSLWHT